METAAPRDEIVTGPQVEVIGVAEENVRAQFLEIPVHDAEGMLVDGRHERLFVFEKQGEESTSRVYAVDVDGIRDGDELELQLVTSVSVENITAADVGRDGVIVKSDSGGLLFPWVGRSVAQTLRQSDACPVALPAGESVAFSRSGRRLYTVPEGSDPQIEYVNPPDAVETGTLRGPKSFARIRDAYDDVQVRPERFVDAGDDVVVVAKLTGTSRGARIPVERDEV